MSQKVDSAMERLIVRLRGDEHWSFNKIKDHVSLSKGGVFKIYNRAKHPKKKIKVSGRPKCTDKR